MGTVGTCLEVGADLICGGQHHAVNCHHDGDNSRAEQLSLSARAPRQRSRERKTFAVSIRVPCRTRVVCTVAIEKVPRASKADLFNLGVWTPNA